MVSECSSIYVYDNVHLQLISAGTGETAYLFNKLWDISSGATRNLWNLNGGLGDFELDGLDLRYQIYNYLMRKEREEAASNTVEVPKENGSHFEYGKSW